MALLRMFKFLGWRHRPSTSLSVDFGFSTVGSQQRKDASNSNLSLISLCETQTQKVAGRICWLVHRLRSAATFATFWCSQTCLCDSLGYGVQSNQASSWGEAQAAQPRVDAVETAFITSIPYAISSIIAPSNVNALAADYVGCQAPITFTNGRAPTQPTASNGGVHIRFSYFISDGSTYSVSANLTLNTTSAFASRDMLGNPYQSVISITGTRTYTYLPTGANVTSVITGILSPTARFYPCALLSSAPGVYTVSTAPFLDGAGLQFGLSNSVPVNGAAPGTGMLSNAISLYQTTTQTTTVLVEGSYINPPLSTLQQQTSTFA